MSTVSKAPSRSVQHLRFPSHPIEGLAGTSFKREHLAAILDDAGRTGFFEVHAENYMGAGGAPHRALTRIRGDYPPTIFHACAMEAVKRTMHRTRMA
jgi:uncharacterized protein (UPF0276 family)